MRAVIFAAGHCPGIHPLNEHLPAPMLPLLDRPFLQHVIERMAAQGFSDVDFVLCEYPEKIEAHFGDGERWGLKFRYHLVRDARKSYRPLRSISFAPGEIVLLAHGDRLPAFDLGVTRPAALNTVTPIRVGSDPGAAWTGWAWATGEWLAQTPGDADEAGLAERVRSAADGSIAAEKLLSITGYADYLDANRAGLAQEFPGLLEAGREVDEGVWLSRNVMLHPTARLVPPVMICEDCQIGSGATLGPNVVVGAGCVLDSHCSVRDTVVFPHGYIGEALELDHAIVDRNRLVNVELGTAVSVTDDFLLGSMAPNPWREWLQGMLARGAAATLLTLLSPLILVTVLWLKFFRKGPILFTREIVALPSPADPAGWETFPLWSFCPYLGHKEPRRAPRDEAWRHLVLRVLPGLVSVGAGDMHFVGLKARSREEVEALPHDWRTLYLRSKVGLITEAQVLHGEHAADDDLYSAETVYAATAGFRRDLGLLFGFAGRLFGPPPPKIAEEPDDLPLAPPIAGG